MAENDLSSKREQTSAGPTSAGKRLFIQITTTSYLCILFLDVWLRPGRSIFSLDDFLSPQGFLLSIIFFGLFLSAQFLIAGFLIALSVRVGKDDQGSLVTFQQWMLVCSLGLGLPLLLSLAETSHAPSGAFVLLSLCICLVGAWVGFSTLRGRAAVRKRVKLLGLLLIAAGVASAMLFMLAIERNPLLFDPIDVTTAEKQRLADVVRGGQVTDDGYRYLRLAEKDVNLLVAMVLAQLPMEAKARVLLDDGAIANNLSVKIPGSRAGYLNLNSKCQLEMNGGHLLFNLQKCRIGRLPIPSWALTPITSQINATMRNDPDLQRLLGVFETVRVDQSGIESWSRAGALDDQVLPSLLARLGRKPVVLSRVQLHFRHLVKSAEQLPKSERLMAILQVAFRYAQQRSVKEDPVLENRAAILSLAVLLGHWRVETLIGPVTDGPIWLTSRQIGERMGMVHLRGREDWRRHFFVSAGLALLSNESVSDAAGLLKEEIDAGESVGDFSFSDLLADRAGTLFALATTRDEKSARWLQSRIVDGLSVDDIFPQASDLPEGISTQQLESDYGGVKGQQFLEMMGEIERRLAKCSALQ